MDIIDCEAWKCNMRNTHAIIEYEVALKYRESTGDGSKVPGKQKSTGKRGKYRETRRNQNQTPNLP